MASTTQKRNLQYRLATYHKSKSTLQSLVSRALKSLEHPKDRMEPLDAQGTGHRLLNYSVQQRGTLCGNVLIFSEGAAQLLMRAQR